MKELNVYPSVYIVLLNWNGKNDTTECLKSLERLTYPNYKIILVDNGSSDGSPEHVENLFPHVIIFRNNRNFGFTGGNNVGIKLALERNADFVLMLNNDTTVEPEFVGELVRVAMSAGDVGIVGPKIVYYKGPDKIWFAGGKYVSWLGKAKTIGVDKRDCARFDRQEDVDWFTGCCMLIRKEVFASIGYLDESYFSSYEDVDFCLKVVKNGFRIVYCPSAKIYHKVAGDWQGLDNPLYVYYQVRNNLLFIKKNLVGLKKLSAYLALFLISFPRRVFSMYRNNSFYKRTYLFMGVKDFFGEQWGQGKLSLDIISELKNKKRIIGINAQYLQRPITGIERYVLELIKNLGKLDVDNKYVLFFNKREPVVSPVDQPNFSAHLTEIPTQFRFLRVFWEQFWLAYELKRNEVQVFHGPSFLAPFSKKSKYVVTIHDLSFFKYPESFTIENKLYFKFFLRRSIKNADAIIADSESTKNDIIYYFNTKPQKISVIYLGVDDKYQPIGDKEKILQVKEKYKLPEKFILFTGVLSPRKNLERTLIAFCLLKRKKNCPHKLVIVGKKGWLYETIFEKIKLLNLEKEVIFTDYIPEEDLPYFYNLADVLVLASLYEGFGLPILEAMACGCPVVTSNRSSMPEVAGGAALLVDPLKVEEITAAIEKVITDKNVRDSLVNKGFEQVKKFSWQKTAEKTLEIYNKL